MAAAVANSPLPPSLSSSHLSPPANDATTTTTTTTTTTYTVDIVNLNNLLSRLEHNIFSSALDLKLIQQSHLHRARVGANVEYANTLFKKIERSLPSIKSPETRHQRTTDLANKRARLARLRERFEEIKTEDYNQEEEQEEQDEEGEDLLAGLAPVEEVKEQEEGRDQSREQAGTDEAAAAAASSTLRQRRQDATTSMSIAASPTTPAAQSSSLSAASTTTSTTTGFKPSPTTATTATTSATTETTLSTHRAEQESLTDSLINLASQLKASSQAFQSSLENEKSILDRAVEGLDRNVTGLDAAGQRMGVLRRMSEGKGWWGRMLMYAWIFGLWLVAIAIVYLGPKLRF